MAVLPAKPLVTDCSRSEKGPLASWTPSEQSVNEPLSSRPQTLSMKSVLPSPLTSWYSALA
ncbi:hypothetical protein D3C72_2294530 [compost metagenome]